VTCGIANVLQAGRLDSSHETRWQAAVRRARCRRKSKKVSTVCAANFRPCSHRTYRPISGNPKLVVTGPLGQGHHDVLPLRASRPDGAKKYEPLDRYPEVKRFYLVSMSRLLSASISRLARCEQWVFFHSTYPLEHCQTRTQTHWSGTTSTSSIFDIWATD